MKPSIDFEHQLHTVPVRNAHVGITESEKSSDTILVEVQLRYKGILKPVAEWVNARKKKRYELSGISREIFEHINGKKNVEDLIDWLCEQEKLTFLEGRALVVHYLRDLMQRGLIVVLAEDAAAKIER